MKPIGDPKKLFPDTSGIAIRCYQNFGFHIAGECHLYDQDFLCYEKALG